MKKLLYVFCAFILLAFTSPENGSTAPYFQFRDGDIILQTSESAQCEAVRIATDSKFSHCGIVFYQDGKAHVLEAVQPVKLTPVKSWIANGKGGKYLVRRLKDTAPIASDAVKKNMIAYGKKQLNKDYDLYFEWSDNKMYCSELVWKIYKEAAGIEITPLRKLKSFKLSHPAVKTILEKRYGKHIPYDEKVVAPSQLAETEQLITVFDNY